MALLAFRNCRSSSLTDWGIMPPRPPEHPSPTHNWRPDPHGNIGAVPPAVNGEGGGVAVSKCLVIDAAAGEVVPGARRAPDPRGIETLGSSRCRTSPVPWRARDDGERFATGQDTWSCAHPVMSKGELIKQARPSHPRCTQPETELNSQ